MACLSFWPCFLWCSGHTLIHMFIILLCLWLSSLSGVQPCEVFGSYECSRHLGVSGCNKTGGDCPTYELQNVTYFSEPSNGTVRAKFLHPPPECCFDYYTIILKVAQGLVNETSCNAHASKAFVWKEHSKRYYLLKRCEGTICNGSICGEFAEVEFGYVFTGCYKMILKPKRNGKSLRSREHFPQFISTSYRKANISEQVFAFHPTYLSKEQQLKISFENRLMFKQVIIEVDILDYSKRSLWFHSSCELCNRGSENHPDVIVEKQVNGTCQNNNTKYIHFTANEVPPGNYSIRVRAIDDRCVPGTTWTESGHCKREKVVNGTASNDVSTISVANNAMMWIIIIIAVILCHAILISWCLIKRQKKQTTEVPHDSIPLNKEKNKANLLLLYPRDCFQFMKTMSAFRRVLECFDDVEVHDCYAVEGDLCDPLDWLRTVMNYPRLYIIVVTSPCACIMQEVIVSGEIENPSNVYQEPTFLDSVFSYGLKQVMNDFSSDVYRRIYIIGFRGFSEDNKMISLPSNLRRYNIPDHVDALLKEMSLEYKRGGSLQYAPEFIFLRNCITNLKTYKSQNPEYLSQVLKLSKS